MTTQRKISRNKMLSRCPLKAVVHQPLVKERRISLFREKPKLHSRPQILNPEKFWDPQKFDRAIARGR